MPAKCRSWTCLECGPSKARAYRRRIEPMGWTYLLTFTLEGEQWQPNTKAGCLAYSAEQIKTCNRKWRMLRQWMRRNLEGKEFVWVNELGDRGGRLHRHCLITARWFSFGRLRSAAVAAGFGRVMRFDRLRTARGGSSYVSKYLTAGLASRWPKGARRTQTSVPALRQEGWIFERLPALRGKPTWWSEHKPPWLLTALALNPMSPSSRSTVQASEAPRQLILTLMEKVHHGGVDPG